jgi:uncharacterized RDD family membrane protein YckC
MTWYYADGSERVGPLDEARFRDLVAAGRIRPETLVWNESLSGWAAFRDVSQPGPVSLGAPAQTAEALGTCSQCGNVFSRDALVTLEGRTVCANCKPLFVARMKEGIAPAGTLRYAGFWIRSSAKFLDGLIMGVVYLVLALLLLPSLFSGSLARGGTPGSSSAAGPCLVQLLFYVLWAGYIIGFVGRFGATPGKMALKLRIVRPDGGRISYGLAAGRLFAELLSGIILYIGYIMAAFDEEKRALHDRLCNTRVVKV